MHSVIVTREQGDYAMVWYGSAGFHIHTLYEGSIGHEVDYRTYYGEGDTPTRYEALDFMIEWSME